MPKQETDYWLLCASDIYPNLPLEITVHLIESQQLHCSFVRGVRGPHLCRHRIPS